MLTLLGLFMMIANVYASLYLFGVFPNSPKWVKIVMGIGNLMVLVAVFGLAD